MNETLATIAEISVAVIGFVAIVSALKGEQKQTGIERVLMINVLAEPIAVVMFALLPLVLETLSLEGHIALRISIAIFALVHLYLSYWVYSRFLPFFGISFPRTGPTILCVLPAILCFVQLIAAAGMLPHYLGFLYLVGLYWLLGMCFLNFLLLFLRSPEDDA